MEQGKKIKNFCNECHHETWHDVLFVENTYDSDNFFELWQDYGVLQCRGCDTVCFRIDTTDSASYDIDDETGKWIQIIDTKNYPSTNKSLKPIENIYAVPNKISEIYTETIKAITNECYTLAGIGLRTTVEAICLHENISGRNLDAKIKKLVTNGFISKDDADKLHAIRLIGNDAAHDMEVPARNKLIVALRIIEHLISTKYAMQDEISKHLELPIKTYDDFKALLNKKIKKINDTTTFTLEKLIGKDRRRIDNNELSSFIQQFETEIQNGKITVVEDVTQQISSTINGNNKPNQKIYRKKNS